MKIVFSPKEMASIMADYIEKECGLANVHVHPGDIRFHVLTKVENYHLVVDSIEFIWEDGYDTERTQRTAEETQEDPVVGNT